MIKLCVNIWFVVTCVFLWDGDFVCERAETIIWQKVTFHRLNSGHHGSAKTER